MDYQNALRFELLGGQAPTFGGNAPAIIEEQYSTGVAGSTAPTGNGYLERGGTFPNPSNAQSQATRFRVGDQQFDTRDAAQAYASQNMTGGQTYTPFEMSAGNQWALGQAQDAIESSAAARGGLFRGSTANALQQNAIGMANQYRGEYLNRLTAGAAGGQAAAGNQANAGANFAAGGTQAYGNIGNAQAAGAIGVNNAIQGGIGNALGMWNYQNQQAAGTGAAAKNPFFGNWG